MEEKANNISRTSYTFRLTQKPNGYMGTSQTNYMTWHWTLQTTEYRFVHNSDKPYACPKYYLKTRSHTHRVHRNLRTKVNRISTNKTAHYIIIKKKKEKKRKKKKKTTIPHTTHNSHNKSSTILRLQERKFETTHDYQLHHSTLSYLANEMKIQSRQRISSQVFC